MYQFFLKVILAFLPSNYNSIFTGVTDFGKASIVFNTIG